ncbi:MAG: hypothetical protein ABIG71_04770 [Candidatus Uhrbacteria bacterium]
MAALWGVALVAVCASVMYIVDWRCPYGGVHRDVLVATRFDGMQYIRVVRCVKCTRERERFPLALR